MSASHSEFGTSVFAHGVQCSECSLRKALLVTKSVSAIKLVRTQDCLVMQDIDSGVKNAANGPPNITSMCTALSTAHGSSRETSSPPQPAREEPQPSSGHSHHHGLNPDLALDDYTTSV
eukprot:4331363-Amphidinium_carterae.1